MLNRGHRGRGKEFHWIRKSEQVTMAHVPLKTFCVTLSYEAWESVFLKVSG